MNEYKRTAIDVIADIAIAAVVIGLVVGYVIVWS